MPGLNTYMASCSARDTIRQRTIADLSSSDWKGTLTIAFDDPAMRVPLDRHAELVRRILGRAARNLADEVFLFLEDDLEFNRHLLHNLTTWASLKQFKPGQHFFASLCNLGVPLRKSCPALAYAEAEAKVAVGSQALLISRTTARYLVTCWGVEPGPHADVKIIRLAARVGAVVYHMPSLVQHVGVQSLWGGPFHNAADFDRDWRSPL
jgi:hypothetical protein